MIAPHPVTCQSVLRVTTLGRACSAQQQHVHGPRSGGGRGSCRRRNHLIHSNLREDVVPVRPPERENSWLRIQNQQYPLSCKNLLPYIMLYNILAFSLCILQIHTLLPMNADGIHEYFMNNTTLLTFASE